MAQYPHPLLAREGWPFIAASAAASLVVMLFAGWWSLPLWLALIFVFNDVVENLNQSANCGLPTQPIIQRRNFHSPALITAFCSFY